jgi:hypothetical protein
MTNEQETKKINYVKPEILDLGSVTPALGSQCTGGSDPTGKPSCSGTGDWVGLCLTGGTFPY